MTRPDRIIPRAGRPRRAGAAVAMMLVLATAGGPAAGQETPPPPDAASACPGEPVPNLSVVGEALPFAYDHSGTVSRLGGIERNSETTSGHDVRQIFGLTRQGFEVSINSTKVVTMVRPDESACVGFSDGSIVLRLRTDIFIASELAEGSCLYDQVLNHEERHAKVGRRLFNEFVATTDKAVKDALSETPFIEATSRDTAPREAVAWLKSIIEPHYRDFKSVYRKRQAIIDTSGEYARVREACPGEMDRVLKGLSG